jgi:hypothetical protein
MDCRIHSTTTNTTTTTTFYSSRSYSDFIHHSTAKPLVALHDTTSRSTVLTLLHQHTLRKISNVYRSLRCPTDSNQRSHGVLPTAAGRQFAAVGCIDPANIAGGKGRGYECSRDIQQTPNYSVSHSPAYFLFRYSYTHTLRPFSAYSYSSILFVLSCVPPCVAITNLHGTFLPYDTQDAEAEPL